MERFPAWRRLIYCSGSAGYAIMDNLFGVYLIFFLLPPAESGLPQLVSNEPLFWGLTVTGLIMIFGRIVDAVADPLIAHWSDNSRSRLGRRRFFMLTGALPFALISVLLFTPPDASGISASNGWYILVVLGAFFFFYTYYIAPYLALIPELSQNHVERIRTTVLQAVFMLVGTGVALGVVPFLQGKLQEPLGVSWAFRVGIFIVAGAGFLLMQAAPFVIDEKRFAHAEPAEVGLIESLKMTVFDRAFIFYLIPLVMFWFCFTMIRSIIPYLPVVMLGREGDFQMVLMGALMGGAVIFFSFIGILARWMSNKVLMLAGLLSFTVTSSSVYFLDQFGDHGATAAIVLMALSGFPVAVILVVPNAIVSDISEMNALLTGKKREAMYFGAQGLLQKINYGFAAALVTYLFAEFGKDAADPMGVKLAGPVGAVFALIGFFVFLGYPQKHVTEVLAKHRIHRGGGEGE